MLDIWLHVFIGTNCESFLPCEYLAEYVVCPAVPVELIASLGQRLHALYSAKWNSFWSNQEKQRQRGCETRERPDPEFSLACFILFSVTVFKLRQFILPFREPKCFSSNLKLRVPCACVLTLVVKNLEPLTVLKIDSSHLVKEKKKSARLCNLQNS